MASLNYSLLPERLRGGVARYIEHGVPPGHFLTAVVSNDLREACARADDENRRRIWEIVSWFYNEAPYPCWGSPDRVRDWLALFTHQWVKLPVEAGAAPPPLVFDQCYRVRTAEGEELDADWKRTPGGGSSFYEHSDGYPENVGPLDVVAVRVPR
jgi:hypothetical protein